MFRWGHTWLSRKKSLQSVENLRYLYLKRGLPFGTDSITAKNSDTDGEVVVQLENVRKTVRQSASSMY